MDIDDILQEVDPTIYRIPQEKRDLQELTRAWIAERSAPELLPYAIPKAQRCHLSFLLHLSHLCFTNGSPC